MASLSRDRRGPTAKLYAQDIVSPIAAPDTLGVVMRCWHDADDMPPDNAISDSILRPLKYGQVGVTFIGDGVERDIFHESELTLLDRTLQPGDYCKRTIDDVHSGVVADVAVRGRVQHVISGEMVEGWFTVDDIEDRSDPEIGDYVVYNDWLGQVVEVYDETTVEVSPDQLLRIPELGPRLNVGERGPYNMPDAMPGTNLFGFGFITGSHRRKSSRVIHVKHIIYAIAWLAVSQLLDPIEAEQRKRPPRYWYGQSLANLTLIRGKSDLEMRVGDRIRLKHSEGLPATKHGKESDEVGIIDVQMFLVTETQTTIDVVWQDGTRETIKATDVIPYLNPDEYDCWPGDHVVWKNEDEKRAAVVQSVNAVERTATILFSDNGKTELVSVLELDPHGTSDSAAVIALSASEGLGVRRGDFVFIHPENSTNGFMKPRVPRIGELEPWVRENSVHNNEICGWRKELSDMGLCLSERRRNGTDADTVENPVQRPAVGSGAFTWIGEVVGLNLDGSVEVIHPDRSIRGYPLERLTRLYDGIEQLEDEIWNEEDSDMGSSNDEDNGPVWALDADGHWGPVPANEQYWEDIDEDEHDAGRTDDARMNVDWHGWADDAGSGRASPSSDSSMNPPPFVPDEQFRSPSPGVTESRVSSGSVKPSTFTNVTDDMASDASEHLSWKRFVILPTAPHDHTFYAAPPAQPSKSFLGRLTKEYRVLASSLPESILVRAYEDRTDLLRCLIIGPHNTPYEDAPFVIDWQLDSNFPNSPPIAHFLSWTNGNGRVNPNLYEEGKVCLSILGTWAGDRNETWSASRSSLLQAFVSIQGLVLVKEPWFCEPAYEKLRGTEEGMVNSRLYSEKAYVLSRGFVRRSLDIPMGDLEAELRWFYYTNGRLEKVLRDARRLVATSREGGAGLGDLGSELAVPRLTAGGIITLERTLAKLDRLLEKGRAEGMCVGLGEAPGEEESAAVA